MNTAKIIEWMEAPSSIDEEATKELREIINEFPASQLLHWLYLKGLQNQKSYLFTAELSRAAIASPDRKKLFEWVGTEDDLDQSDKKQKFEFDIPEPQGTEVVVPESVASEVKAPEDTPMSSLKVEDKELEISKPIEAEKKPAEFEAKAVNEKSLPADIQALLAKSKRIRKDFHQGSETPKGESEIEQEPVISPKEPEVKLESETSIPEGRKVVPEIKEEEPKLEPIRREVITLEDFNISIDLNEIEEKSEPAHEDPIEHVVFDEPFSIDLDEGYEDDIEKEPFVDNSPLEEVKSSSFSSWLRHLKDSENLPKSVDTVVNKPKKVVTKPEVIQADPEREEKIEIIDRFLEKKPKIRPNPSFSDSPNLAEMNSSDNTHLITETLADVYVEQGHFGKAIEAYEILCLKYPEKSGFFADRIREIKKRK